MTAASHPTSSSLLAPDRALELQRRWRALSEPYFDTRRAGELVRFRRFGELLVALAWTQRTIRLQRVETLSPGGRDLHRLMNLLKGWADEEGFRLCGNAFAYPTIECPEPDQERLIRFYRRWGVTVGPAPWHFLEYGGTDDEGPW